MAWGYTVIANGGKSGVTGCICAGAREFDNDGQNHDTYKQ